MEVFVAEFSGDKEALVTIEVYKRRKIVAPVEEEISEEGDDEEYGEGGEGEWVFAGDGGNGWRWRKWYLSVRWGGVRARARRVRQKRWEKCLVGLGRSGRTLAQSLDQ